MRLHARWELARADDLTLGTLLERFSGIRGSLLLVDEVDGFDLTFAEAADLVSRAAGALHGQIGHGERVLVATPNGYGMFLACLAVARAGGVAVPVNSRMTAAEIGYVERDADARARIEDFEVLARTGIPVGAARTKPTDVAALLYTSGTTGEPKGARLTHRALVGHLGRGALVPEGLFTTGCVTGLPVAHVAGFTLLLHLAAIGMSAHLMPRFRPTDALDLIETRRPVMFVGVPAMYRMMLEAGARDRDLSSVHLWSSGADRLDESIVEFFQRAGSLANVPVVHQPVGDAIFLDGYGMVEAAGGVAVRVFPPVPTPFRGLLRPIRGHRVRVVDDAGHEVAPGELGELLVAGPGVMRGYHGGYPQDRDDGWLHTGDLARRHRFGFFELAGRKKDVIKHGGFSVYAAEIERVLGLHADVVEAVAVGLPDLRKGELPVAAVRVREGSEITADELRAFAATQLADYKRPQIVRIVDAFPRTGTDKVDKRRCRALFRPEVHSS